MRVMVSAVLLAFAIFVVVYRNSLPEARKAAAEKAAGKKPFPALPLSSEGSGSFAWIPKFPGAQLENITTKQSREQLSYGFNFHTPQEFGEVLAFYGDQLKKQGFKVELRVEAGGTQSKTAPESGGQIHAESSDGARSLDVVATKDASGAEVGVTAVQH